MCFGKAIFASLLLFVLQGICLGQISSYTDVAASGDSVVAYGAILDDYSHGQHTNTTVVTLSSPSQGSVQSSGGDSATSWISISEDGYYTASTSHDSWCPYTQSTISPSGGSSNSTQVCVDTCTPCQNSRENQTILCFTALGGCEGAALTVYNNAIQACDNQNYCQPSHPAYNQQQCDTCKGTASENLIIAQAVCGGIFTGCMFARPDCSLSTIKKLNCDPCSN
jgi:hypothetical protein